MLITAVTKSASEHDFRVAEVELDEPRSDEVLVRISGVGICHTDLVYGSGMLPFPFPAILGHEGAGIVEKVGGSVTKLQPGDHVVISFESCGECRQCRQGEPPYCETWSQRNLAGQRLDSSSTAKIGDLPLGTNFFGQSSMASHAIASERNCIRVDKDLPIELLGPLACGVQTGAGAVLKALNIQAGDSLVVFGGGTVGLSAVMAAAIRNAARIVLVEPMEARRKLGVEFGATATIDPLVGDLDASLRHVLGGRADYVLECTGIASVQKSAYACLGKRGTFGLIAISKPGTLLPAEANALMSQGQKLVGIIEGDVDPAEFLPELIAYFRDGKLPFTRMVKTYPLTDVNRAIADQHAGVCVKPILIP